MLKWDKVKDVEKYEVSIEGEKPAIVTTNAYNISNLDRSKERKVDIISLSGTCRSEVSSFIIPASIKPNITVETRGSNIIYETFIKLPGRHKLKYGYSPEKLDKEVNFTNIYELYIIGFYFRIDDGKIYFNSSFLRNSCDVTVKTIFEEKTGKDCPKSLIFTSNPKPDGYVVQYMNEKGLITARRQLSSNIIEVCKPLGVKAVVYPFYHKNGHLCSYGEGMMVDLSI